MTPPPLGLCCEVTWLRNRDADTPEVRLRTGQTIAVRLIDCWAAERGTRDGDAATAFLDDLLGRCDPGDLRAWFPPPPAGPDGRLDITDVLRAASFDRLPGRLYIGSIDVSDYLVQAGHATATRRRDR